MNAICQWNERGAFNLRFDTGEKLISRSYKDAKGSGGLRETALRCM
jgi:hypothetical protein